MRGNVGRLLVVAATVALLVAGCSSSPAPLSHDGAPPAGTAAAPIARSGVVASPTAIASTSTSTSTATGGSPALSLANSDSVAAAPRYIAGTGGVGVALRWNCAEPAKIGGGWAEGTAVTVVARGINECGGWSVARAGSRESWVANSYLADAQAAPAAAAAPTTGPAGQFSIVRTWLTNDGAGNPVANIELRNDSSVPINAFYVRICAYDASGQPVKRYGDVSNCIDGTIAGTVVGPGGVHTAPYVLLGQRTAAWVAVNPVRSQTTTGVTWKP